mmetsp:Transcript_92172/g.263385  ORF Transcript_92172/g.263385 Transcript_92172/m.263385 type:complete len:227 (-) Transcript_92172:488-1168(-)
MAFGGRGARGHSMAGLPPFVEVCRTQVAMTTSLQIMLRAPAMPPAEPPSPFRRLCTWLCTPPKSLPPNLTTRASSQLVPQRDPLTKRCVAHRLHGCVDAHGWRHEALAALVPILMIVLHERRPSELEDLVAGRTIRARRRRVEKVRRHRHVHVPHRPVPVMRGVVVNEERAVVAATHGCHSCMELLGTFIHNHVARFHINRMHHTVMVLDLQRPRLVEVMRDVKDA